MPRKTNCKKQCDTILRAYYKHCKAAYSMLKDRLDGGNMIQESDYSNMGEIEREEVQSLYL